MREKRMTGTIIKNISSFYYVDVENKTYVCKVRGKLKNKKLIPFVGDKVDIEITDDYKNEGVIEKIRDRKNFLIRPNISNIDAVVLFFSVKEPDADFYLTDRFIIQAEYCNLDIILCFSKIDLSEEIAEKMTSVYRGVGYPVYEMSIYDEEKIHDLKEVLKNKTTVISGPSGAGKSSFIKKLRPDLDIKTDEISQKIGRGKNTTRHTELVKIDKNTWIADTPGFYSLNTDIKAEELKNYFIEFNEYTPDCKFIKDCVHINEPDCEVKKAVENGFISRERYLNYLSLYNELILKEKRNKRHD